jgi:hypothetical protein
MGCAAPKPIRTAVRGQAPANWRGVGHIDRSIEPPSTPSEARQETIARAEAGEQITTSVANEIVAGARKKDGSPAGSLPPEKLGPRLIKVLERYRPYWNPKALSELARQLREFADTLEEPPRGGPKRAKG